jgi:two-component system, response regulator YesN
MTSQFKILIVEDSRLFRQVFRETLHTRFPSFEIHEAADGKEALQLIEKVLPHLVFMDIQLPEVNGLELTRKIKIRHPEITSVIFTGYDSEYREAARQSANYFLSKRSTSEDVFKLIENIWKTFKEMPAAPAKPEPAKKEKK